MTIIKNHKKTLYFFIYFSFTIFLQACSTENQSSGITVDESKDLVVKNNQGSLEEAGANNLSNTCPRGLVCAFPGRCSLFLDQDYNKICDRANI